MIMITPDEAKRMRDNQLRAGPLLPTFPVSKPWSDILPDDDNIFGTVSIPQCGRLALAPMRRAAFSYNIKMEESSGFLFRGVRLKGKVGDMRHFFTYLKAIKVFNGSGVGKS